MDDSATRRNIAEELLSGLREWGLPPEGDKNHGYMVMDAGRNMLTALNKVGLKDIVCMAHKLHLLARNALGLGSQVRETWCEGTKARALLEKCRQLIGHFSCSMKAAWKLREKQEKMGMAEHVLVQDMSTRWNSTSEMLERLVEQKDVLEAIMSTTSILPGGGELDISVTDWRTLRQMVDILKAFEEATKVLCGLNASLAHAIPLIHAHHQGLNALNEDDSLLLPRKRALVTSLRPSSKPSYLACVITMAVSRSWVERPAEEQDSAVVIVWEYMADPLHYWLQLSQLAMNLFSIPPISVQSE
ncbi:hypothetical protein JRQ81_004569 [Phrynocephalus forsythii]|uniref:Zinc finger BED domain-containing protein 4 n=1 Tax=Phrynocephalus forsythii TaxID=171643 RepID=A0A9Q1B6H1_9SAUR|nr:hypothetical protein JRQ81_004569 [Phrynocephalus forsythii]